jgi:Ca2+-binding EF-hand superfamily protein
MILTIVVPLPGQEMAGGAMATKSTKRAEELLKRYDKNGDGRIDDDERAEAKEVMMKDQIERQMGRASALPAGLEQYRAQALELFDKNRDGRLDDTEKAAVQKFLAVRDEAAVNAALLAKRFDKNGDGTVDAAEQATIESFIGELRAVSSTQARSDLMRMFDRDTDGKISDEEFVELEKFVRPRVESSPVQVRRHDSNGDGKLDETEWKAACVTILQWLNASGPSPLAMDPIRELGLVRNSTPAEEQARLNAVAAEVARRRAQREAATKGIPTKP